jgi:hypothetical protein
MIEWGFILSGGLLVYGIVGIDKWLRRRAENGKDS